MKKILFFAILMAAVSFGSCGNKTSVTKNTTDTVVVDSDSAACGIDSTVTLP